MRKFGIALIVVSCVAYGSLLLLPFFHLTFKTKGLIGASLVIVGEVTFWTGGLILGREFVVKYRRWLDPRGWLGKKPKGTDNVFVPKTTLSPDFSAVDEEKQEITEKESG